MNIELPLAPSQNQLLRMHWSRRRKLKIDYTWLILQAVGNQSSALNGAHIKITRRTCGVEPDPDNLTASAKLILDALQQAGVIKDDSPKHVSLTVLWEKCSKRKDQGTLVEIRPWELGLL